MRWLLGMLLALNLLVSVGALFFSFATFSFVAAIFTVADETYEQMPGDE